MTNYSEKLVSFIWDVADLLRGPYRPPEYRKVMLPMTVLRRLDCVLEGTRTRVLEESNASQFWPRVRAWPAAEYSGLQPEGRASMRPGSDDPMISEIRRKP